MNKSNFKTMLIKNYKEKYHQASSSVMQGLSLGQTILRLMLLTFGLVFGPQTFAAAVISDDTVTDVTTRAFSVVWRFDEPILSASIQVFVENEIDPNLLDEITNTLNVSLVSAVSPEFHDNGLGKIDVTGAEAESTYFILVESTGVSGSATSPDFLEVITAAQTRKEADDGSVITNDLIGLTLSNPDGTQAQSTLMMLETDLSPYPLTALVGEGGYTDRAVVDMNNLFSIANGELSKSIPVPGGTPIVITELRGLLCDQQDHTIIRQRRAPEHTEVPPITELEAPAGCFSPTDVEADFDCDGRIGGIDFVRFAGNFGLEMPDCRFHNDFDLDGDGRIGGVDFVRFSSVFGAQEQ